MSSSKKKKLVVECNDCCCFVLAKDLERHKAQCGSTDIFTCDFQLISPSKLLIARAQSIDKPETYLPPGLFGWHKHSVSFVHPDTLSHLDVLPRQPCLLETDTQASVTTLWPCDQVSQMRFWNAEYSVDRLVRIIPIPQCSILESHRITLQPLKQTRDFYSTDHFREYVSGYLSNSFLSVLEELSIPFYGQICEFAISDQLDLEFEQLKISDVDEQHCKHLPPIVHLANECSVKISMEKSKREELSFSEFGGAEKAKCDLQTYLISPLKNKRDACSIVVSGISGCGKTLLLNILNEQLNSQAIRIETNLDLSEQFSTLPINRSDSNFVIIIDDYEELKRKTNSSCANTIAKLMDTAHNMSVVLAVRQLDDVELSLRRHFTLEIELTVPSLSERIDILKILFRKKHSITSSLTETIKDIASGTHGFTGSDLKCLCELAEKNQSGGMSLEKSFEEARKRVRPTGIRQFVLEVPDVRWEDIGGYEELKTEIQQAVIWPQSHPEAFERFGVQPPSGILLYGPPGCSKTLVARALASQSHLNFLAVKGPELFSKWVGESERAVRELFRRVRQVAPAILFFDEIDAIGVNRGEKSGSGVGDRVLAQLLTELDGLEKKSGVLVLAATNRPDTLDSALLRPGRLDRAIYVPLPDSKTRLSILRLHLYKMPIAEDVDINKLADQTNGYSGAEVVALCHQAALIAMREDINSTLVKVEHFNGAFEVVKPRTDKKLVTIYENFQKGVFT